MAKRKPVIDINSLVIGVILGIFCVAGWRMIMGDGSRPAATEVTDQAVEPIMQPQDEIQPDQEIDESVEKSRGRVAIIIDDWGYTTRNCHFMKEIEAPFSVAILPNLQHTGDIAQCAQDYKKQIMLHLPLEPNYTADRYPKGYLIKTTMGQQQVRENLETIFERMPWVEGVNNHMGSKATADLRLMGVIMQELKKRNLFFIDSLVTNKTVAADVAKRLDVPFARRDIFLDNVNRRSAIEAQFADAMALAEKTGQAILIGHDRPLTMQIMKEQTRLMKEKGFNIVPIQELLH